MRLAGSAIIIAVLILGCAAIAQQTSGDDGVGLKLNAAPSAAASSAPRTQVDESALRYFASQGDTRRVNAEIARLRALYPNWSPPSDLSQLSGGVFAVDPFIEQLWNLYKEDKIAEIRAAIAERQGTSPDWQPPEELVTALETVEARRRLLNASDGGQWRTVLSVATETPSLLTCSNVDVLWRVAEAFAKTEQPSRTQDVYVYLLTNCADPGERLATLQKAFTTLSEQQVADLLRFERKSGGSPDDFAPIRDELARRRVERAAAEGAPPAAAEDIAVVERLVRDRNEPGHPLTLGWYNYHHDNPAKALEFFKIALDRNGGAKAAEGYAMALRGLERLVDAEAFAYEWRDKAPDNMKVYLDVATALLSQDPPIRLDAPVVARIVPVVAANRFVDAAQALGWYSYNTGQFRTARDWFRTGLGWKPDNEPSAYGMAIASQRLNDLRTLNIIVAQWRSRSQRIADLVDRPKPARTQRIAVQALESLPPSLRSRYVSEQGELLREEAQTVREQAYVAVRRTGTRPVARRACTMTNDPSGLPAGAALSLGWCLMEINRPLEAVAAFDQAIARGSDRIREEAAYGKSLAYLRKNLTSEAAVAAAEAPLGRERRVELGATILAQRAVAAYRDGRYMEALLALGERARIVPEQNDLMLIRGWSYFKLARYQEAERIFRAVQRTGYSEDANIGLNATLDARQNIRQ